MRNDSDLTGQLVRLPDGQRVRIETVFDDGYAVVRRIEGAFKGEPAVCAISSLEASESQSED